MGELPSHQPPPDLQSSQPPTSASQGKSASYAPGAVVLRGGSGCLGEEGAGDAVHRKQRVVRRDHIRLMEAEGCACVYRDPAGTGGAAQNNGEMSSGKGKTLKKHAALFTSGAIVSLGRLCPPINVYSLFLLQCWPCRPGRGGRRERRRRLGKSE